MKIITDSKPRYLLELHELTDKEREDFQYVNEDDPGGYRFFRYRGKVYDTNEFMRIPYYCEADHPLRKWQGYHAEGFYAGVVLRYADHGDQVVVGRYVS